MNPDDLAAQLYRALWQNENDEEVIGLFKETLEGPFFKCNMYNQSVLAKALYMKRYSLADKILDQVFVSDRFLSQLSNEISDWGDTILHNAATSSKGNDLANKLLEKAPNLLAVRNKWGETAVFQACRYGKRNTFDVLAAKVDHLCKSNPRKYYDFFQRDDNTTILHMAILTRNFGMALKIAQNYQYLNHLVAGSKMTPLQMLACSPTEFKSGAQFESFLEKLVYSCTRVDLHTESVAENKVGIIQKVVPFVVGMRYKPRCILPMLEAVKEIKEGHKIAQKLAEVLIRTDESWKKGPKPSSEFTPQISDANSFTSSNSNSNSNGEEKEIPLFLAAKYGIVEIVKEILKQFPQAVDYLNHEQQTFIHVAIKHRKFEVFELINPKTSPLLKDSLSSIAIKRLFRYHFRAVDCKGNSILHMVGISGDIEEESAKTRSPVLRLSKDLQLLEYLKKQSPKCLTNHRNNDNMTADEVFAKKNENLCSEAKEWLKRTAEHCTVVIVLIATVAFAAAYTIPGGPNSKTGYPLLISKPFFLVFTIADVLSLGFALTAVVIFLAILTSSFQMKEFRRSLPEMLLIGFTLLLLSVSMMMVAFAATIILMINNNEGWTKIAVYAVAFFPVCVFILSYIPLYIKLFESLRYWAVKIGKSLPQIRCDSEHLLHRNSYTNV